MKKKFLVLIMLVTLLTSFLISCASNGDLSGYPWELAKNSFSIYEEDDIFIEIKEGSLEKTGLEYVVYNNSNSEISFGSEYYLQIKVDEEWYQLALTPDWTAELCVLESGKESEWKTSWKGWAGKLPDGEYRMVIPAEGSLGKDLYIAFEFKID